MACPTSAQHIYLIPMRTLLLTFLLAAAACVGSIGTYANNLEPMYGNLPKTQQQLELDRQFITEVIAHYPNKRLAALDALTTGWTFFRKGDLDTAIKRFNQAWLLDPTLADVYEAFGVYLAEKKRVVEAKQMLEKAHAMDPSNKRIKHNLENLLSGR